MEMDKFVEDTNVLMNQPIAAPKHTNEPELISVNLPHDFSFKHSFSSTGSQHTFDNNQKDNIAMEEKQESFGQRIYSTFSKIGEGVSNFFGCSQCFEGKKSPKYDLENLPSGLDALFNTSRLNSQQSPPNETFRSGMDSNSLEGVENLFKTPRINEYNCFNPLNMFRKSSGEVVHESKFKCVPCFGPNNSAESPKSPIAYKLHAIEIHQPISCYSSSLGHPAVVSNSAQLLQNGLKALDENFSGVPALTMGQVIQQHNRAVAVHY